MQKVDISQDKIQSIDFYLQGDGIDLSRERSLQEGVKHIFIERNGLFSLRDHFKPESLDFLYINDIHETKFYNIILKEMLIYCKIGGFIVIDLKGKGIVDFKNFSKEAKKIVMNKAGIRKENVKRRELVFQKTRPFLEKNDSIDKWTFGVISNGKKIDQIDRQIQYIKELKIPHYEIIVVGIYKETKDKNIKYIYFNDFDIGWISAKKNKIFENAKYENVVIMHDRILLNKDFYEGMKKYGNYFEVLSCKVLNDKGERCGDWFTYGNDFDKAPRIGYLEYSDWDKNIWIDGAFYIMKKSSWKVVQVDEALLWDGGEDMKLAKDWKIKGIVPRFNQFSSCLTLSWRHGVIPMYEFDDKKLGERIISKTHQIKEDTKFYIKKVMGRK